MKALIAASLLFFSYNSHAGLIAISCQDKAGFTLTADKKEGTMSDYDGSAIGVFNMVQTKKNSYRVNYPMISVNVTIKEVPSEEDYKTYKATVVTEFDGKTQTKVYEECVSY